MNCGVLFLLYKLWIAREKAGTECGGIYKERWEIIPPFKAIAFRVVVSATTQRVATTVDYVAVVGFFGCMTLKGCIRGHGQFDN